MTRSDDPFDVLGLPPSMDLDQDALEARYLALSRECHPDYHSGGDPAALAAVMSRAAAVNDAYKTLRDPWRRARALVDRLDPAAFDAHKRLDPVFLADAMDLAEDVAGADDATRAPLESRLRAQVDADLRDVADALRRADADAAATRLHQSQYHRKALADLRGGGTR